MPQRNAVTGRSQEPRKRFAQELRRLREEKGETLQQLAEQLGWDASTLGKLESGRNLGGPEIVQALDQHYGTTPLLMALWELAILDMRQFKAKYRQYMKWESEAVSMWHYGPSNLHGLLQTADYARELLTTGGLEGEELDTEVENRRARRELLLADDAPPFRSIIPESVLRTPLKELPKWCAQLEDLLEMSERDNVTIQVLRTSVGLHALTNTDAMFMRSPLGQVGVWVETGYTGELLQESAEVERLQLGYDRVRDLALSPDESREFIRQLLEEAIRAIHRSE
ncbi:XRE family transcriptional regulator [Streptomyces sp. V2]|uniref:helix-turn-helix domain-containing protein n=1 Tax=Streptomyces TaxID=1883 RepID=UPI0007C7E456|nr:XRE family transcriptional regulator [Streptomyces sp. V2]